MDVLVKILQFLLSLSILVMLHELGHFVAAKIFRYEWRSFLFFSTRGFPCFVLKGEKLNTGWDGCLLADT